MTQDYKSILKFFYDEFGDDLVDIGKAAIHSKLQEMKAPNDNPTSEGMPTGTTACTETAPSNFDDTFEQDSAISDLYEPAVITFGNESESAIYYDADTFEELTLARMEKSAAAVIDSADVAGAVKDLIMMAGEVRKFEEAQITVRTDIAARRDIAIANIKLQETALMTYLDKSFDERRENFQKLFSVVDDALVKDNMQELAMGLESIIKLAESSPFKDLQTIEATATALANPDHEWDF